MKSGASTETVHRPPEGVLRGESFPRENEESEYERIKRERVKTLKKNAERAKRFKEENGDME